MIDKQLAPSLGKFRQHRRRDRFPLGEVNDLSSKCSETVLNGSAQLVDHPFNKPSGRTRVECTVEQLELW